MDDDEQQDCRLDCLPLPSPFPKEESASASTFELSPCRWRQLDFINESGPSQNTVSFEARRGMTNDVDCVAETQERSIFTYQYI
jgi:hypothetical protein